MSRKKVYANAKDDELKVLKDLKTGFRVQRDDLEIYEAVTFAYWSKSEKDAIEIPCLVVGKIPHRSNRFPGGFLIRVVPKEIPLIDALIEGIDV